MIEFDPHIRAHDLELYLVGCGGTGSAIATIIGRTIYHMKMLNLDIPERIVFVDPDIVEEKNVGRQAFLPSQIGKAKAEILASRIGAAFGLEIEFFTEEFNDTKHFSYRHYTQKIILGAVDNHNARKEIAKVENAIWIDSGNDKESGQVVIGNTSVKGELLAALNSFDEKNSHVIIKLPNASMVFPELLLPEKQKPEQNANLSCAALLRRGDQHLLINNMMANVAGVYLYNLLMREPVYTHYTYVGLNSMRSEKITIENLRQYAN